MENIVGIIKTAGRNVDRMSKISNEQIMKIAEKEGSVNPNDKRISIDFCEAQRALDNLEKKGLLEYSGDATYLLKRYIKK
jgi:hypothetical protein